VALEQLAEVRIVTGPAMIQSEDGMLRTVVLLNVKDRDLGSFVEEAKAKVQEKVPLPQGYTLRFAGQYENQIRSQQSMMILVPVCLLLILGVIWWDLRSASQTFLVFTSIPIAFAGGLLFLWIGEFNTSVAVWVGFITLFGIAVDDGVLMMTFLRQAIKKAQPTTLAGINDCILEAGSRRIRPLVMTAVTSIVSLLPVMWATSAGSEIMKPMAIPTIGGLLIEGISLFVVPVLYSFLMERRLLRGQSLGNE
jgi:Cu(I)/Ag(I) efflux system membrane protein CusA/SilA